MTELGAPIVINLKFRSEKQGASFASPSSQRSDDPLGLRSTFENVKSNPEEGWNSSTLSPDLSRREKGANVVWSHPKTWVVIMAWMLATAGYNKSSNEYLTNLA